MHNVIRSLFPGVIVLTLATALSVSPVLLPAQVGQMYLDPSQPIDKRVDDLVSGRKDYADGQYLAGDSTPRRPGL
jgi:hypothetical protein